MSDTALRSLIKKITITSPHSTTPQSYDVSEVFEELSIFENMLVPVMTGNIVIRDAVGFSSHMRFDGSEYIEIEIQKYVDSTRDFNFKKTFVIYSQSDRKNVNQKTEMYILHFASAEYVLSAQTRLDQIYEGTHADIISSILVDKLKVDSNKLFLEKTSKIHTFIPGTKYKPFEAIELLTKRSISTNMLPEYFFWNSQYGYHFNSLSTLMKNEALVTISSGVKNVGEQTIDPKYANLFAARDIRIKSGFNFLDGVQEGMYSGRFIGFDTLTRTIVNYNLSSSDIMKKATLGNSYAYPTNIPNSMGEDSSKKYDSKITLFPTQYRRGTDPYLKATNTDQTINLDDTEFYVLQRPMLMNNLFNKTIEVVLPGSFFLNIGDVVNLNIPVRDNSIKDIEMDPSLSGKYLVTMIRHVIQPGGQKHETILHLHTNSTNAQR